MTAPSAAAEAALQAGQAHVFVLLGVFLGLLGLRERVLAGGWVARGRGQ